MRTIETKVYTFTELSDEAKEKAREWARGLDLYGWSDESLDSIKSFCRHFGINLVDWSIGPWSPIDYRTDADNSSFRGVKLSSIKRDNMPTGYCLDCDLWTTFYDEFKRTGAALCAFNSALDAGFKAWRDDWESAYADEQVDDMLTANDYEFTEEGERV